MCGIAGYWTRGKVDPALLTMMGRCLAHRGPDFNAIWSDDDGGIGLAFRRLAIVDLTPSGNQPMTSANGRWTISYNGEIYNYEELRAMLAAPPNGWRGHSDTEVLLEAIATWGLEWALRKSVGMFAISLWDNKERRLYLARDRFGEKPLYYGRCGRDFVFASELKAIRQHPDFDIEVSREALAAFAALGVVPAPMSIHHSISKLEPGTILSLDGPEAEPHVTPYWSYRDVILDGLADPFQAEDDAVEALDAVLRQALAGQSVADVPVGAFLSGGIDSSAIVALYHAVSGARVKTYTIGFDEAGYDESADARRVAEHLGTEHHEHRVGVAEARDVIPLLPAIYDEPFADSSQIPTYLVSKFAKTDVTVAISGDGGDELFGGYNRHRLAPAMWKRIGGVPVSLRKLGANAAALMPAPALDAMGQLATGRLGTGAKIAKAARIAASAKGVDDVYADLLDEWCLEGTPVVRGTVRRWWERPLEGTDPLTRITYADAMGYLPDDILTKVDRAAMAVSLETRVPFLDHRVAAVAARIPAGMKVSRGKGKQILRRLLDRYVPRQLVERPKAGFAVPVGEWIKGPLRGWAEDLLDRKRLDEEGYWDTKMVHKRWQAHLAGRDATPAVWSVLIFQAWLLEQRKRN